MMLKEGLPIEISSCPIVEAMLEISYSTQFPVDAVFGIIFKSIQKHFPEVAPNELPIMQLPVDIRNNDPNLKYQAYYV